MTNLEKLQSAREREMRVAIKVAIERLQLAERTKTISQIINMDNSVKHGMSEGYSIRWATVEEIIDDLKKNTGVS